MEKWNKGWLTPFPTRSPQFLYLLLPCQDSDLFTGLRMELSSGLSAGAFASSFPWSPVSTLLKGSGNSWNETIFQVSRQNLGRAHAHGSGVQGKHSQGLAANNHCLVLEPLANQCLGFTRSLSPQCHSQQLTQLSVLGKQHNLCCSVVAACETLRFLQAFLGVGCCWFGIELGHAGEGGSVVRPVHGDLVGNGCSRRLPVHWECFNVIIGLRRGFSELHILQPSVLKRFWSVLPFHTMSLCLMKTAPIQHDQQLSLIWVNHWCCSVLWWCLKLFPRQIWALYTVNHGTVL